MKNKKQFNPTNISQLWSGNVENTTNKWSKIIHDETIAKRNRPKLRRDHSDSLKSTLNRSYLTKYDINDTTNSTLDNNSDNWNTLATYFEQLHMGSVPHQDVTTINDLFNLVLWSTIKCKLSFDISPKVIGPVHWGNDVCDLWTMLFYIYGNNNDSPSYNIKYSNEDGEGQTLPKLNNNVKKVFKYCGAGGGITEEQKDVKRISNENYIKDNFFDYYDLIQIISNWIIDSNAKNEFLQYIQTISTNSIINEYINNEINYNLNDILFGSSTTLNTEYNKYFTSPAAKPEWLAWVRVITTSTGDENDNSFIYTKLIHIYIWCSNILSLKNALENNDIPTYSLKLLYHYLINSDSGDSDDKPSVFGKKKGDANILILTREEDVWKSKTYNMKTGIRTESDQIRQGDRTNGAVIRHWYAWLDRYSLVDSSNNGNKLSIKPLYTSVSFAPVPYFIPLFKYFKYYEEFYSWITQKDDSDLNSDNSDNINLSKLISYIVLVLSGWHGDKNSFDILESTNKNIFINSNDVNQRLIYLVNKTCTTTNGKLCSPKSCADNDSIELNDAFLPQAAATTETEAENPDDGDLLPNLAEASAPLAEEARGIENVLGGVNFVVGGGGGNNNSSKKKVFKLKSKKGKTTYKRKKYHASSTRNTKKIN